MSSWLKHTGSRLSLRRSTTRYDCFVPPSPERLPRVANARASWAGRPATASTPTSTSTTRTCPREQARSSSQLRRCYGPCQLLQHPRRKTCTARHLSSRRLCNRPKARRPTFASRAAHGTTTARKAWRRQFTRAAQRDSRPTRAERRSGSESSTRADRPRTVTPATSSTPAKRATRRHGR
jgi:hypothetical protein